MNIKNIPILIIGIMILWSCKSSKDSIASYYTYEIECLGVELDGSQTLRTWGSGKDKSDAIEQAKKNAVHTVLFKGVRAGKSGCETKPLVLEVNAEKKYAAYFNKFFKDGGSYKKFVNTKDENKDSRVKESNSSEVKYGITVRVLSPKLKKQLEKDGIIKQ